MPELAEVEFFRRRWQEAAKNKPVTRVLAHERARSLRGVDIPALRRALVGARLVTSAASAKQMAFRFSRGAWLGVHLGMSGELRVEPADYAPGRHDHLALFTARHALIYTDPRMFGRVQFQAAAPAPATQSRPAPQRAAPVAAPTVSTFDKILAIAACLAALAAVGTTVWMMMLLNTAVGTGQ